MKRFRALLLLAALLLLLCGCSRYTGDYNKAIKAFSAGDYGEAARIFDLCDPSYGNSATYAAYSHGMVLWEQEQYTASMPYFEQCKGFLYGTQRWHYAHAVSLTEGGDFASARQELEDLGDFETAPQLAQYCAARSAENAGDYDLALAAYENAGSVMDAQDRLLNLQTQIYNHAIELMNGGDTDNALILFNYLGDYLNSAEYARRCRNTDRDAQYEQAEACEEAGELQEAYQRFNALGNYRDSAERANNLAEKLGIPIVDETRPE